MDKIQKICDELSVCRSCYDKVHAHLKGSCLCHVCFHSVSRPDSPDSPDFSDLRWIGDEQVVCCGDTKCEEQIKDSDKLATILGREKNVKC